MLPSRALGMIVNTSFLGKCPELECDELVIQTSDVGIIKFPIQCEGCIKPSVHSVLCSVLFMLMSVLFAVSPTLAVYFPEYL